MDQRNILLVFGQTRPIVLGISESWLDSSTTNGALAIPSFTIHRRDRQNRGGGILVYLIGSGVGEDVILRMSRLKLSG